MSLRGKQRLSLVAAFSAFRVTRLMQAWQLAQAPSVNSFVQTYMNDQCYLMERVIESTPYQADPMLDKIREGSEEAAL